LKAWLTGASIYLKEKCAQIIDVPLGSVAAELKNAQPKLILLIM